MMIKRNWLGYYALVLACLLASCKEEIQDTVAPNISIMSPTTDTKLWLDVSVKAEVTDDQKVASVEFYLDDELLGEDTEAPYELSFNSKQYEDGKYALKALAYDGRGNQTEARQEIEIFNALLKVEVEESYLKNGEEEWVVVGKTNGELIESFMLENGKVYRVDRPEDFLDEEINIMRVNRNEFDDSNESIHIWQHQYLKPQNWTLKGSMYNDDSIGSAKINYYLEQNESSNISTYNVSRRNWGSVYYENGITEHNAMLKIAEVPARAFTYIFNRTNNEPPRYNWITSIELDKEYNLTEEDFTPMQLWQNISLPLNEVVILNIRGKYNNSEVYDVYWRSFSGNVSSISAYVPNDLFEEYKYGITIKNGPVLYYKTSSDKPDNLYEIPQVGFEIDDNSIESFSALVDYEADFVSNLWRYRYRTDTELRNVYWYIDSDVKEGNIEVQQMNIPAEIYERYSLIRDSKNNLSHEQIQFFNYDGVSSLNGFIEKAYDAKYEFNEFEFILVDSEHPEAKTKENKHIQNPHDIIMRRFFNMK
ncbi:hypothetical protein OKW21_003358 [Catalinimonas alkaloidigena]|uniref:Ig-like domain-containing protein n=1 Tax=Catalinimonas alkaloidigena TaxID=1075417 RepID=UPI0024069CA0|nr:Ig-like domain-containing protein [Catalinimonas alkaloidigena]MDF9798095.1 hypothetical protein [Catalinimonas alkaloidigena]